jgi:probable F420-dependent oxidoreductase
VITPVARAAEECGFATLWAGEHVVMVDEPNSVYPYADDGHIAVPSDADWLDPLVLFGFVAAVTSRLRLATGVLLLPEHNPVTAAKAVATLDRLSSGRFTLGVGIGWSAEEFDALGIPFAGRGSRTEEYVEAMRVLWRDDESSYTGRHVRFEGVRCYPKPVRRSVPVVFGGNGERALRRAAAHGDGWYGFNVVQDELAAQLGSLRSACQDEGRSPQALEISVDLRDGEPQDLPVLEQLGVDELVVVETPPDDPGQVADWVRALADRWAAGMEVRPGPNPGTAPARSLL